MQSRDLFMSSLLLKLLSTDFTDVTWDDRAAKIILLKTLNDFRELVLINEMHFFERIKCDVPYCAVLTCPNCLLSRLESFWGLNRFIRSVPRKWWQNLKTKTYCQTLMLKQPLWLKIHSWNELRQISQHRTVNPYKVFPGFTRRKNDVATQ